MQTLLIQFPNKMQARQFYQIASGVRRMWVLVHTKFSPKGQDTKCKKRFQKRFYFSNCPGPTRPSNLKSVLIALLMCAFISEHFW